MPFDGSKFSQFQPSMPVPFAPAPLGFWVRLNWFLYLLPSACGIRGWLSRPADQISKTPTACLLREARGLIGAEAYWAKKAYSTADGRRCAMGALSAAARGRYGLGTGADAHGYLLAVARWRGFDAVETMNDESTHTEILAAFDAAIVSAESH